MSVGVPLTRLYFFFRLLRAVRAGVRLPRRGPAPVMQMLLGLGPAVAVAAWLAADARHTRTVLAHDTGFFFYLTWPLSIPWYAVRRRGRRGWRLAAQLYVIALAGWLGYIVGAVIAGTSATAASG